MACLVVPSNVVLAKGRRRRGDIHIHGYYSAAVAIIVVIVDKTTPVRVDIGMLHLSSLDVTVLELEYIIPHQIIVIWSRKHGCTSKGANLAVESNST